ncbi:MAG: lysyl-tRNA synthetase, class, partial [Acidimicrobiaceae bacterium]|nr:lysyl-tRNA synthetase, class [Acidimicrobiaceae bacterium]
LWRFNAKFDPTWVPRYVVLDRPQSTLFAGLAIASVESLWELPIIGRALRPNLDALRAK